MKIKKAIITAAGRGSRLLPVTHSVPKELLPIRNVPVIDYILKECYLSGIREILFVISETKSPLIHYICKTQNEGFKKNLRFVFVPQINRYGTASAVLSCEHLIEAEDFSVIFPDELFFDDTPALLQILESYYENNSCVLGSFHVRKNECSLYGIIQSNLVNGINVVQNIVEKPQEKAPSQDALCGRFILKKEILPYIKTIPEHDGEFYLTDAISRYIEEGNDVLVKPIIGKRFDCGKKEDLSRLSADRVYSNFKNIE